mgnify:FL=1
MPYLGNTHIVGDSVNNFKVLDDISSYTATFDGSASSVVSTAAETIKVVEHRFVQGQRVTYNNGGGSNIGGLSSGTAYFVTYDTANTIKLATSLVNANNNTNINLTSVGSGTAHTLTAAFDGVNKKFRITHGGGTRARFSQASQLNIAINNVIQKPNNDHLNFSEGFAIEVRSIIVFQTAPTVNDVFFGSLLGETLGTFDLSDHKIDNHTADGSTTNFNLSRNVPNVQSLLVTLDGVLQHPSDATTSRSYSLSADNIIEFTAAPASGVQIQIRHLGFAGAATGEVSGFYGRTGNVGLTTNDHITTGDITSRNINASGIITASSFIGDGSGLIGVASTDNIVTGTAATFNTYPVDINAGMTVAGVSTFSNHIDLPDDALLRLGVKDTNPGGELTIEHSSSNVNYIKSPSNRTLQILGNGGVLMRGGGNENIAYFLQSSVKLYQNQGLKLETTSKGIEVGAGVTIETNGQATFVGVVTFGSGSTTIDNNVVNVGTALTLGHTQGLQFHTQNLHSAGFEVNQINSSGIITASSLDVSGNVSIGGTLTYEDVTNIDSVGVITARKGIVSSGVVTATTFSGSGASLTNLNASNIASGTVPTARLGSGTANNTTFLRGDSTFQTVVTDLVNDSSPQLGGDLDSNGSNIKLGDSSSSNDDRLQIGAATYGDLEIFHDGSSSYMDNATGDLYMRNSSGQILIRANTDAYISNYAGNEHRAAFKNNGAVELYHDGTKKFETTSNGNKLQGAQQDLWGDVKFDNQTNSGMDLRWDESLNRLHFEQDNIKAVFGAGSDFEIFHDGTTNRFQSNGLKNFQFNPKDTDVGLKIIGDGAVELYHDGTKKFETSSDGVTMSGTGGFVPPVGTTAQRPSGVTGMIRYNSQTTNVEFYTGSEWKNINFQPFSAGGGTESTSSRSGYKVHTFTSPGTFAVSGDTGTDVEVLVIGGGGAGGEGGGGAGAIRFNNAFPVVAGNYSVTIGGGGSGGTGSGNNGSNSVFGNITAAGGGGGGGSSRSSGNPGGSGGGSRRDSQGNGGSGSGDSGGSTNSNSPSNGWGNNGASGTVGNWCGAGGGGGAGGNGGAGNGGSASGERGGNGGSGLTYSINGSSTTRAGGGGGGTEGQGNPSAPGRGGNPGSGGGGRGGVSNQVPGSYGATAGSANTGGGGGGNAPTSYSGGNHSGGSGVVIVAYTV